MLIFSTVCIAAIRENPYALNYVINQTPELCIEALKVEWHKYVLSLINIPMKGKLLKEINRMKLIKGPMRG